MCLSRLGRPRIGLWSRAVEPLSLVLLGCRVTGPAALSAPAQRRAERAVLAFEAGLSRHILVCGGKAWHGIRETDALCAYLTRRGVPERAVEREPWSRSTRQNAHYAARLLLPRGWGRIALVTCDWHMPRALQCFRGAGFDALALPATSPPAQLSPRGFRTARELLALTLDAGMTLGFSRV